MFRSGIHSYDVGGLVPGTNYFTTKAGATMPLKHFSEAPCKNAANKPRTESKKSHAQKKIE